MSWLLQPHVRNIIEIIANNREFTEKSIKKQLKIKENEIRKVLYKLEEYGIVVPIGTIVIKEGKFDFKWKSKINNIREIYRILINNELKNIENSLKEIPRMIFYCINCGISYNSEEAYELNFHCKECDGLLIEKENKKVIEIEEIKEKLIELLNEIVETEKIKAKK